MRIGVSFMGHIAPNQKPTGFSEDEEFCQELEHHIKVIQVMLCDLEQATSLPSLGSVPELVCLPVRACGRKECRCSPGVKGLGSGDRGLRLIGLVKRTG